MSSIVLIDTGPLVAFFDRRDAWHGWAVDRFRELPPPLSTCEAVLAEAAHLLRRFGGGPQALLEMLERGAVVVPFRLDAEFGAVRALMDRYAGVPMSLADACLVRMSEQQDRSVVLTLDADFRIYRRHGRETIPLLTPERP